MNRDDLEVQGLAKFVEVTDPAEVEVCKQWLRTYAKKKRQQKDRCIWSYNLKHIIENATGEHITNQVCIQAAVELGFDYWLSEAGINANFHMELQLPQHEWKRVKPEGFSRWLFKQDDLRLAQDAKADPTWPRPAKRFIDFWRYLRCDSGGMGDELCRAWESWTGRMAPRPDVIDTDVVYNRECDFISYGEPYPNAPEDSTYLYALVETDEQYDQVHVKYVGQTQTPSKRLREHILRPGSIDRVRWMGGLLQKEKYPQMAIFYSGAALSMANGLEKSAIYAFQSCETRWDDELDGFPPLDDALLNIDIW